MKDQELVPLRVVLRNFLNHIENLESQSCPDKSYESEFQDLKLFSENVKTLKEYSCLEGEKEVNRKKNRYKDILPFDLSRVVLSEYAGIPGSDYINANFIKGASGSLAYIASQGPLPSTVNDFWRMVVECEVQVIVMACNEEEAGKAKCEKYWVDECEERQFGMTTVKLLKSSTVCSDFSIRTMRLKYPNADSVIEERTVCQLHYVAWPDHGVPTVVQPLLDMVRLVRDTQASETLPVLVHCSAGCGRTGTICAIDYVWGLLRTGKLTSDFSLLSLIRDMRKQRIAMVQTKEQYVLVHQAVRELFKEQLSMIDSHPYENVDSNGLLVIKEEEHTYDSIDLSSNYRFEEKNDNKEKDSLPPPLPSKRNISKFPSKFEKEIENLSAQRRSMKTSMRHVVPSYPSKEKSEVTIKDSHNENFYKRASDKGLKADYNKPIPPKGILSVPQLESAPKCKSTVKRSKSLKVVRNCEKNNLSFLNNSPPESKRRSSLESNFDEHILDNDLNDQLLPVSGLDSEHKNKNVSQLVSKYDILKNQDHRTFVRSLTCTDFRQKITYSTNNSVISSLENSLAKQRVKLLRSNTQINVKKGSPDPKSSESISGLKFNSPQRNYYSGSTKVDPSTYNDIKIGQSSSRSSSSVKQSSLLKMADSKDVLLKSSERIKNPVYQKFEGLRIFKESPKLRSSVPNRPPEPVKRLSYEEAFENYSADRNLKVNSKSEISNPPIGKLHLQNAVTSIKDNSKIPNTFSQPKFLKSPRKQQVNSPVASAQGYNLPKNILSSPVDHFKIKKSSKESTLLPRQDNSLPSSSHVMDMYSTTRDLKPIPSYKDSYRVKETQSTSSTWVERDGPGTQTSFNNPIPDCCFMANRPVNGHPHLFNTSVSDDSKEILKKLDDDCIIDRHEHVKNLNSKIYVESSHLKTNIPPPQNDNLYHFQNKKNVHQYNGSVVNARHLGSLHGPHDIPSTTVHRISPRVRNPMNQPRTDAPSGSQDTSFYSSGMHQGYGHDFFSSAPGVDLDQVAASITKNDKNLMKATLEELQVRKTKSLKNAKDNIPPKGIPSSSSGMDKKWQQQYL